MDPVDYPAWLESAKSKLFDLQARKNAINAERMSLNHEEAAINVEIDALAQTVSALSKLVPEPIPNSVMDALLLVGKVVVDVGMTSRVKAILQANPTRDFSATEVRSELEKGGFVLGDYSNALATIYTVLGRIKEVEERKTPSGRRFYWRVPAPTVLPHLPQFPQPPKPRRKS